MNKSLKKMLGVLLSLSMIAGSIVLPTAASAAGETPLIDGDTVIKEWKLSFGTADAPSGYTHVPRTAHAVMGDIDGGADLGLGFVGTHADDFNFANNHDGLTMTKGHVTNLKETANGVGSTGDGLGGNGFGYPLRFALNAADGQYFRVKMELTNLDEGKDATDVTVYAERKHNITSHETITAGDTMTLEFSVDVEPNYFKGPGKRYADGQLNIVVAGENTAVKSMTIQQVNPATTLWVLGDSTVTDGNDDLPYFELDNYTGIGSGITKYLRGDIAMSNQGEGGLNATDRYHFDVAKENIKAGDYMWVEYGHNHKNGKDQSYTGEYWLNDFLQALPKYYNACKSPAKGGTANGGKATLVMVGPIDRNQDSQYNSSTNTWSSTLSGFSNLAKQYVDVLRYGGEDEAAKLLAQWASIATYAEAHKTGSSVTDAEAKAEIATMRAAADKIVTDAVAGGEVKVSNVAFVDLNADTLKWLESKSAGGSVGGENITNNARLTDFYYRTERGATSRKGTDNSHPNDAGAEALAELFFLKSTAKATEYPAIKDLLSKTDGTLPADTETPTGRHAHPVDQKIMDAGWAGNTTYWPDVVSEYSYAVRVKKVNFDEDGKLDNMEVILQDNKLMTSYGLGIIAVYNKTTGLLEGTAFSSAGNESKASGMIGWVDNSNDPGTYTLAFDGSNLTYDPETQNMKAYIWSMGGDDGALDMKPYSNDNANGKFIPLEFEYILTNDSLTGPEQFHYYGIKADTAIATGQNGWTISNITATTKSETADGETAWYGSFANTSAGSMAKSLTQSMSDGIIEVSGKIRSVTGKVDVQLTDGTNAYTILTAEGTAVKNSTGTAVDGVTLGSDWTEFTYTLDINKSQETLSVGSVTGTPATASAYNKLLISAIKPLPITALKLNAAANSAFELTDLAVKNVARTDALDKVTMAAGFATGSDDTMGTLTVTPSSAELGSAVTYKAVDKAGFKFTGWYTDEAGANLLAPQRTIKVKAANATIYAKYAVNDGIYYEEDFEDGKVDDGVKSLGTGDSGATGAPDPVDLGTITVSAGYRNNGTIGAYAKIKSGTGYGGDTSKYLECTMENVSSSSRGVKFTFNNPVLLSETMTDKDIAYEFDTVMKETASRDVPASVNFITGIGRVSPLVTAGLNSDDWVKAQIIFDKTGKNEYLVIRDTSGKILNITTLATDFDASEITIDGAEFYGAGEAYPSDAVFRFDNFKIYDIGTNGTTAMVPVDVTFTAPAGTTIKVANDITAVTGDDGKATLKLVEGEYDITATNADYKTLMDTITVDSNHAVTLTMEAGTTSTVALTYVDADDDSELKSVTISQKANGAGLFSGDSYTLEDSYKVQMKVDTGDGDDTYYIYKYDTSNTGDTIASLTNGSNPMTIKMQKVSNHKYYYYQDYTDATEPDWTVGNATNATASLANGALKVSENAGKNGSSGTGPALGVTASEYTMEFDLALTGPGAGSSSGNQGATFSVFDSSAAAALALSTSQTARANKTPTQWTINNAVTENTAVKLTAGATYHYKVVKTASGATLTITDSSKNALQLYTIGTAADTAIDAQTMTERTGETSTDIPITIGNAGLSNMKYEFGKYNSVMIIDNIEVYANE